MKIKKYRTPKPLSIQSDTATLALKVYSEQCPEGFEGVCSRIQKFSTEFFVAGIIHLNGNAKSHMHIMVKPRNAKKRFRVKRVLSFLKIDFRPGIDDEIIAHRGIETLGNISAFLVYMLHLTPEAIQNHKTSYSIDDIKTNAPKKELKEIYAGYQSGQRVKTEKEFFEELCIEANSLGKEFGDYRTWSVSKIPITYPLTRIKKIEESYKSGFEQRAEEYGLIPRTSINIRCCKRIKDGLTYYHIVDYSMISGIHQRVVTSFKSMGLKVFVVEKSTDELLNMPVDTDVIIIKEWDSNRLFSYNELIPPRAVLLKNNVIWCGEYVITYNAGNIDNYVKYKSSGSYDFICQVYQDCLDVKFESAPRKPVNVFEESKKAKYIAFRDMMMQTGFRKSMDYSDL